MFQLYSFYKPNSRKQKSLKDKRVYFGRGDLVKFLQRW